MNIKEYEYYRWRRAEMIALLRRTDMVPMGTLSVGDFKYLSTINAEWACYDLPGNENRYWTAQVFLNKILKEREL